MPPFKLLIMSAAFYIDAAVSEDIRFDPDDMTRPAILFFLIDSSVPEQAMRTSVHVWSVELRLQSTITIAEPTRIRRNLDLTTLDTISSDKRYCPATRI